MNQKQNLLDDNEKLVSAVSSSQEVRAYILFADLTTGTGDKGAAFAMRGDHNELVHALVQSMVKSGPLTIVLRKAIEIFDKYNDD